MKKSLTSLLALVALSLTAIAAVDTGAVAPDFTLTDTSGTEHSMSDFKGKYVVLEWTNHRCPFVAKHYSEGDMQALQKAMTDDGAIWLQINSSAPGKQGHLSPKQGEVLRSQGGHHSTALLLDESGAVGRSYGAKATPHMFVINPEGVLIYQGAIDSIKSTKAKDIPKATNYVKAAYENAKVGKPVDPSSTAAYGCGIKY